MAVTQKRCEGLWPATMIFFLVLTITGCTTVGTRTIDGYTVYLSKEAFAEYVESTFRYHNRVVNELIMVTSLGAEDLVMNGSLARAEARMAAACQPLNEIVSATIERRRISLWSKILLLDQVPECAAMTRDVERLIPAM